MSNCHIVVQNPSFKLNLAHPFASFCFVKWNNLEGWQGHRGWKRYSQYCKHIYIYTYIFPWNCEKTWLETVFTFWNQKKNMKQSKSSSFIDGNTILVGTKENTPFPLHPFSLLPQKWMKRSPSRLHQKSIHRSSGNDMSRCEQGWHVQGSRGHPTIFEQARCTLSFWIPGRSSGHDSESEKNVNVGYEWVNDSRGHTGDMDSWKCSVQVC